jgi:pyridoxal phosphate-dependent aminotransferase EpsN
MKKRILLSIPHMGGTEQTYVGEAFSSNWLSSVGPNLNAFEREFQVRIGRPAVALASGTAAVHLGLRLLGVQPGDIVFCSTLTFAGSSNPIRYLGAEPHRETILVRHNDAKSSRREATRPARAVGRNHTLRVGRQ